MLALIETARWVLFLLMASHSFFLFGQIPDNGIFERFSQQYDTHVGIENNQLYHGSIYQMVLKSRVTHQFFQSKVWEAGDIRIGENLYYHIPMVFDLEKELVVLKHPDLSRSDGVSLDMSDVNLIKLHNHLFRRVEATGATGLYDILHEGEHFDLVCKRSKIGELKKYGLEFRTKASYYLIYNQRLMEISSRQSLFRIFPQGKEIAHTIKKTHGVKFKKQRENELVEFMRLFDARI